MTPNPQAPQVVVQQVAPAPNALMVLLGGLLGGQGTLRRILIGLVGGGVIALNDKLGLGMDFNTKALIAGIVVSMITGGNVKEAVVANAQATELSARHEANASIEVAKINAAAPAPEAEAG